MLHTIGFLFLNVIKLELLLLAASRAITKYLSSSLNPIFLCKMSLHFLRMTLTHFVKSSYEHTLCLPTSFSISGLATLNVKPRVFTSSGRIFASTHLLMHYPFYHRFFLLALSPLLKACVSLVRSRHSLLLALALILLFLAKVQLLPTLTFSHDIVIWIDGSVFYSF